MSLAFILRTGSYLLGGGDLSFSQPRGQQREIAWRDPAALRGPAQPQAVGWRDPAALRGPEQPAAVEWHDQAPLPLSPPTAYPELEWDGDLEWAAQGVDGVHPAGVDDEGAAGVLGAGDADSTMRELSRRAKRTADESVWSLPPSGAKERHLEN